MAHLLKTAWRFGLPLYSPTTRYYLPSHSYLSTRFVNECHGGLLELACYTSGWVVSIDEGRDRNLGTTSHNGSGKFHQLYCFKVPKNFHMDSKGFHLVSQGIAVNARRQWKIWVLSNNNNHSPFHLRSGNLWERC